MEFLHRVFSGQTLEAKDLKWAGWFVLIWFAMDVIQFIDFVIDKFR